MVNTDLVKKFIEEYHCNCVLDCGQADECYKCKEDFKQNLKKVIDEQIELERMEY